jgi:dTDP-4-dehydrorhamnose reductase
VPLTRAELDVTNRDAVERAVATYAPDLIINAAAYNAVDRAETDQATAFAVNGEAVGALAGTAREIGAHFVHISTDFVFDGKASQPYRSHDRPSPLSVYGASKLAGEQAAGPEATVVRTSWVYAPGNANFLSSLLSLMLEREELRVVSDQIGSPTWAMALAQMLWRLSSDRRAGLWHYADEGQTSRYEFAIAMAEEARALGLIARAPRIIPITTETLQSTARRPAFSPLDSAATHAALDTEPAPWRANLRRMLAEQV